MALSDIPDQQLEELPQIYHLKTHNMPSENSFSQMIDELFDEVQDPRPDPKPPQPPRHIMHQPIRAETKDDDVSPEPSKLPQTPRLSHVEFADQPVISITTPNLTCHSPHSPSLPPLQKPRRQHSLASLPPQNLNHLSSRDVQGTKQAYEAIRREWRSQCHENDALRVRLDDLNGEVQSREEMVAELLEQVWQLQKRANDDEVASESLMADIRDTEKEMRQWRRRALSAEALLKKEWDGREKERNDDDEWMDETE